MKGTCDLLSALGDLYSAFGIHSKGSSVDSDINCAFDKLEKVDQFVHEHVAEAKAMQDISASSATNGLQGTISVTMLLEGLQHIRDSLQSMQCDIAEFGSIMRESVKRSSRWCVKYYTHPSSYYPVPSSRPLL